MPLFSSDYIDSDDFDAMNAVLDQSKHGVADPSRVAGTGNDTKTRRAVAERHILQKKVRECEVDIEELDKQLEDLQRLRQQRLEEQEQAQRLLDGLDNSVTTGAREGLKYGTGTFPWTDKMKDTMLQVFKIKKFRLCQEGVCNANMDNRDIVCVMPTGGGKSLTYQLPAILGNGCTLVVSPLISLISDQIMHLRNAGIEAVKITGSTSKDEHKRITSSLYNLASNRLQHGERPIKLCYVTPEKISKSKTFLSLLQKLADKGRLERIVIDEAHCVSQLGHDFRPDYKELKLLRKLFPQVPIMALTATCPPKVLDDLISILGLAKICDGYNANLHDTVYFTAPLYRPNLHYKAFPKPSNAKKTLEMIAEWIMEHHPKDSGIVYCLSRKDTENVAEELQKISNGGVKTGFYHADKKDTDKESLHELWHKGDIQVVCATIAFGMGIDKSDVRFVIHHSISKSLDGFYQESGRAGRDGKDADCVMYYRPQDAWSLAGMLVNDKAEKLFPMINFVQDTKQCRKLQFANYFSHSANLAITAWGDDALKSCGHCDNCQREEGSADECDVTYESWQLLKLVTHLCGSKSTFTAVKIATLARSKDGSYLSGGHKQKIKEEVDLNAVCGGQVKLGKEDIEFLLVYLWTKDYLKIRYQQTAYSTLVYITAGPMASRLTSLSAQQAQDGTRVRIKCTFPIQRKAQRKGMGGKGTKAHYDDDEDDIYTDDDEPAAPPPPRRAKRKSDTMPAKIEVDDDDDVDDDSGGGEWSYSLRKDPPSKKQRTNNYQDIIEIDSD